VSINLLVYVYDHLILSTSFLELHPEMSSPRSFLEIHSARIVHYIIFSKIFLGKDTLKRKCVYVHIHLGMAERRQSVEHLYGRLCFYFVLCLRSNVSNVLSVYVIIKTSNTLHSRSLFPNVQCCFMKYYCTYLLILDLWLEF